MWDFLISAGEWEIDIDRVQIRRSLNNDYEKEKNNKQPEKKSRMKRTKDEKEKKERKTWNSHLLIGMLMSLLQFKHRNRPSYIVVVVVAFEKKNLSIYCFWFWIFRLNRTFRGDLFRMRMGIIAGTCFIWLFFPLSPLSYHWILFEQRATKKRVEFHTFMFSCLSIVSCVCLCESQCIGLRIKWKKAIGIWIYTIVCQAERNPLRNGQFASYILLLLVFSSWRVTSYW